LNLCTPGQRQKKTKTKKQFIDLDLILISLPSCYCYAPEKDTNQSFETPNMLKIGSTHQENSIHSNISK